MPTRHIAKAIVQKLVDSGHIAYFAGGWVRDYLLQRQSDDIDIATSAGVDEVRAIFSKTIPVGVAFGIVIVVEENHQFEVATFRKDRGYIDGRRPTGIDPATPEEDAQRRDFTINGMFYDPLNDKLLDFVDGQKDLKKGIIKAIGNPHERFLEDRLRMMRAVRYSTRFNFPIESETLEAILAHAHSLVPAVAMERVWQEFKKMSSFAHFDIGLVTLHRLNLLPTIFPTLQGLSVEHIQDRLKAIPHFPKNSPAIAELLELFPKVSLQQLIELCEMLKLSNQEKEFVRFLQHSHNLLDMPKEWLDKLELLEWAQFYANPHSQLCLEIVAARLPPQKRDAFLQEHAKRRQPLEQAILRIQSQSPIVRAEHLMKEGIFPGKKMGLLLKEAERISINEGIGDRESLISLLKQSPLWSL
jgi:poly(A) polymerase